MAALDQQHLPKMAPKKNRKVHDKAVYYAQVRDARMAASKVEKDAKTTLIDAMAEANLTDYVYGPLEIHIDNKKNIKVTIDDGSNAGEGDGDE